MRRCLPSSSSRQLLAVRDKLWLRCEYDNTLDNPGVQRALLEAGLEDPVDVGLGEGSLDEMCIGILGTTTVVPTVIEGESHSGIVAVQASSEGFGFDDPCDGPSSLRVEINGTISGLAACGLDVLGLLATIEFDFEGIDHGDGTASGEVSVSAVGVGGGGTATWTGTYDGEVLTVPLDLAGVFADNSVSFEGAIVASNAP